MPSLLQGRGKSARYLVLISAFLGWFCAGLLMSTTTLAMRSASIELLDRTGELDQSQFNVLSRGSQQQHKASSVESLTPFERTQLSAWKAKIQQWFAFLQCAMLLGAAAGGFLFGSLGDRFGRSRAMAASILCYSMLAGISSFATSPPQLVLLWFLASLGIGGIWPNGVALVSEFWSDLSRPLVAGIIGTAANMGIFLMATIAAQTGVGPAHWRWMFQADAIAVILGLSVLCFVPESPRWLAAKTEANELPRQQSSRLSPEISVFRPPLLAATLTGIALASIPLIGAWGSANWMVPWAGEVGESASPPNPYLQAQVGQARALTGIVGSLLGGWVAQALGRRLSYALMSLAALTCALCAFWFTIPSDAAFMIWASALGFFSGLYFGWLPLFLPELFPTWARSTGSGVSFNSGRILTAVTIFATGTLTTLFGGDYASNGRVTSLIYVLGIVAIWFAPDTSKLSLDNH